MSDKKLTLEQQYMIDQVAATMAIENMPLSKENIETLQKIVTGEITIEESIAATKRRYSHVG